MMMESCIEKLAFLSSGACIEIRRLENKSRVYI